MRLLSLSLCERMMQAFCWFFLLISDRQREREAKVHYIIYETLAAAGKKLILLRVRADEAAFH